MAKLPYQDILGKDVVVNWPFNPPGGKMAKKIHPLSSYEITLPAANVSGKSNDGEVGKVEYTSWTISEEGAGSAVLSPGSSFCAA